MTDFSSGREAALARRRALSSGKAALPPSAERTRGGFREARPAAAELAPAPQPVVPVASALSGRQASIARRRSLAAGKAGAPAELPAPSQGPRERRSRLTASRVADGLNVTGAARGALLLVSGTQNIVAANSPAAGVEKVGHSRTEGGLVVSGAVMRSAVAVTGDERGDKLRITGEADPRPADDLTQRPENPARAYAGRRAGSRQRELAPAVEVSGQGAVITGSDVARAQRVTIAAPNVSSSSTWGGKRVSGVDVQRNAHVTGDPQNGGDLITGAQYDPPQTARSAAARRMQARARLPVTGDAPVASEAVSGLERGAARDITGTPYVREETAPQATDFSIVSPQRAAQLRRGDDDATRITGSFAVGGGKVTGNVEFSPLPRSQPREGKAAHNRLTGEGAANARITGDSWADNSRVTGSDGAFASGRNPTERGEKAAAFAGSATFKKKARHEEARQLVTGMVGYFSKTGARVTLTGGAQS